MIPFLIQYNIIKIIKKEKIVKYGSISYSIFDKKSFTKVSILFPLYSPFISPLFVLLFQS